MCLRSLILLSVLEKLSFFNLSSKWIKVLCLLAFFYIGDKKQRYKQTETAFLSLTFLRRLISLEPEIILPL